MYNYAEFKKYSAIFLWFLFANRFHFPQTNIYNSFKRPKGLK